MKTLRGAIFRLPALLLMLGLAAGPVCTNAEALEPGSYSQPKVMIRQSRGNMVAMPDDGVLRARSSDPSNHGRLTSEKLTGVEPNKVYEYGIEYWRATGSVFQKGHRIRVAMSSSLYPYHVRNLNAGDDNVGLEAHAVMATQRISNSRQHPSHIILPLIAQS